MGILGLSKLIADLAPQAIRESEMKNFFGESKHYGYIEYI